MGVPCDVQISVTNLAVIRKSLDLAALFATTAPASMREVNRVENRTMPPRVISVAPNSQEDESRVGRILVLDAELLCQKPGHVHAVRLVVPRFMVAADNCQNLVRDGLNQVHHRRQFFHRREVRVRIAKARLQRAVEEITR